MARKLRYSMVKIIRPTEECKTESLANQTDDSGKLKIKETEDSIYETNDLNLSGLKILFLTLLENSFEPGCYGEVDISDYKHISTFKSSAQISKYVKRLTYFGIYDFIVMPMDGDKIHYKLSSEAVESFFGKKGIEYDINIMLNFTSKYQLLLYRFFKYQQIVDYRKRISFGNLLRMLNAPSSSLDNKNIFNSSLLFPAIKYINKNTDIEVICSYYDTDTEVICSQYNRNSDKYPEYFYTREYTFNVSSK